MTSTQLSCSSKMAKFGQFAPRANTSRMALEYAFSSLKSPSGASPSRSCNLLKDTSRDRSFGTD